jgi:hypothetical protein
MRWKDKIKRVNHLWNINLLPKPTWELWDDMERNGFIFHNSMNNMCAVDFPKNWSLLYTQIENKHVCTDILDQYKNTIYKLKWTPKNGKTIEACNEKTYAELSQMWDAGIPGKVAGRLPIIPNLIRSDMQSNGFSFDFQVMFPEGWGIVFTQKEIDCVYGEILNPKKQSYYTFSWKTRYGYSIGIHDYHRVEQGVMYEKGIFYRDPNFDPYGETDSDS